MAVAMIRGERQPPRSRPAPPPGQRLAASASQSAPRSPIMADMRTLLVLAALLVPGAALGQAPITIRASRVLDGRGGMLKEAIVVVSGSKIRTVRRAAAGDVADYDLTGMTLLPGLIDAHEHIGWYVNREGRLHTSRDGDSDQDEALAGAANAYRILQSGFTTVQSPGFASDAHLRNWIGTGRLPGPRVLTSLEPLSDSRQSPEQLRQVVQERKQQGADLIKIFASASIRTGGQQTMSDEQLRAICGEAKRVGLRTLVHAHSAESVRAATLAGCTEIEHGIFVTPEVLALMASHGTYFDPQCGLVFHNYLDNRHVFEGIGSYNEEGFAAMEKAIPRAVDVVRQALATPGLKVVFGTDALAASHGRSAEDLVCRVQRAGEPAMHAIVAATSLERRGDGAGRGHRRRRDRLRGRPHRRRGGPDRRHCRAAGRRLRDEGRARVPRSRADGAVTTERLYDRWADSYDEGRNRTRDLAGTVMRSTLPQPRGRVLELGCGTGRNTGWLAERAERVLGIDASDGMLGRAAERRLGSRVSFARHDVRTPWPLRDGAVDAVVAMLVLEHVEALEPVFREAARVLRADGEMFVCELHPFRQLEGVRARFADEDGEPVPIPAWLHMASDYVNAAIAVGLTVAHLGEWRDAGDEAAGAPPRLLSLRLLRR